MPFVLNCLKLHTAPASAAESGVPVGGCRRNFSEMLSGTRREPRVKKAEQKRAEKKSLAWLSTRW